ncbi:MAG: alpha/beta hydrolase [Bacteroidota bacterium]
MTPPNDTITLAPTLPTEAQMDARLKAKFFPKGVWIISDTINGLYKLSPKLSAKLTMFLLSVSMRRKLKTKDKSFYQKGIQQTFRCQGKRFNTYTFGQGPKILFVHGWVSNGARWQNYVDEIVAKGFSAVVVDSPAQGTSKGFLCSIPAYIDCIRKVLNAHTDWHGIVAHSIGSIVSMIAASEAKTINRPLKIVLMSTFSDCYALMTKYARCLGIAEEVLNFTKKYIPKLYGNPLSYFSLIKHYKNLSSKGLLIHDRNDIVVPYIEVTKITTSIPDMAYFESVGAGHNLNVVAVKNRVIKFLD